MNDKHLYQKLDRKVRELESDLTSYLHRLEESVEKRTRELEASNRKLKAEVIGRKKSQQEVQTIKKEWEKTFDAMVDWVSLLDLDCTIIRSNRRGEKLFGVPVQEMIGLRCCKILHGSKSRVPECPMPAVLKFFRRESVELQLEDGRWMMISIDPIVQDSGGLLNVVHICRDITERKRIEIEKEKMLRELQTALADVKTLSDLLPICSVCKKIRDDKGYWNQIEAYIHEHSGTRFSHGICPECAKEYYPDLDIY